MDKAYVITTPCAGKSTFVQNCPEVGENASMNVYAKENYDLYLYDHDRPNCLGLGHLPNNSCILGCNHVPDIDNYIYAVVLIDKEQLNRQIAKREIDEPLNGWTKELIYEHPEFGYYAVQKTAIKYNIPVFNTFEKALDFIITEINGK